MSIHPPIPLLPLLSLVHEWFPKILWLDHSFLDLKAVTMKPPPWNRTQLGQNINLSGRKNYKLCFELSILIRFKGKHPKQGLTFSLGLVPYFAHVSSLGLQWSLRWKNKFSIDLWSKKAATCQTVLALIWWAAFLQLRLLHVFGFKDCSLHWQMLMMILLHVSGFKDCIRQSTCRLSFLPSFVVPFIKLHICSSADICKLFNSLCCEYLHIFPFLSEPCIPGVDPCSS